MRGAAVSEINVSFVVPLPPRGQGRARAAVVAGRAKMYKPAQSRRWEDQVALVASQHMPADVIEGPVRVDVLAVVPRPQRLLRRRDPDGPIWCTAKPDADNVAKSVLDALKRHWRDDSQVVDVRCRKVYAERSGLPRVEVRVARASNEYQEEGI